MDFYLKIAKIKGRHFFKSSYFVILFTLVLSTNSYALNCGDPLTNGTWKGVVAYYNGSNQGSGTSCNGTGTFGGQYQCTEYVKRFYYSAGMNSSAWSIPGDKSDFFNDAASHGLKGYSNGGTVSPKTNDILVFDDGGYGHLAIVTGVTLIATNTYRVDFVEQNWSETGASSLTMYYDSVAKEYTIQNRGSYVVVGWMRIPYSAQLYAQDPANTITVHPGETYTFAVYYTDTMVPPATTLLSKFGSLDWKNDAPDANYPLTAANNYRDNDGLDKFHYVELHSVNSQGEPTPSFLYPGNGIWISNDKVRVVAQSSSNCGYNQNAKFLFQGTVPATAQPGTYKIYFRPYHATGGYLEGTTMYFTIEVVSGTTYSVGQGAPSNIATMFVSAYSGNETTLGNPTSTVKETQSGFGTVGYYQKFENGSIQIHSNSSYIVYGTFYQAWGNQGYATWAGFPTSNRYSCTAGECQDFEGGYIQTQGQSAQFISDTHPTNLTASVQTDKSVLLNWQNRITTAQGINVYRTGSPTERIAILGADETSFVDTTSAAGHPYTYSVQAYNETAESPESNQVTVNSGLDNGPWPMFSHDVQHTGKSNYKGFECPLLKWRYQIGNHPYCSPVIALDGTIYVVSDATYLRAINSDGSLKWGYQIGSAISSSPAIGSDATICVWSNSGSLYAINADGSLKWRYQTGVADQYSSPAIGIDGTIYSLSKNNGYLYAVNSDGSLRWQYQTGGRDEYSSPAIGSDGTIYVGSSSGSLYAVNSDGSLRWQYQTGYAIYSFPTVGLNSIIYIVSNNGYLYAIDADGSLKWRYQISSTIYSAPTIGAAIGSDGTIYVGSSSGYLYAINSDGSLKWRYQIGSGTHPSPTIGLDGTIYVGSNDHYFYAINSDGSLRWQYQTGTAIYSFPTIGSDGTIYVESSDYYLCAIGLPSGKGCVYGTIKDLSTNKPIPTVTVSTIESSTQTDSNGYYALGSLPPGVYTVTFSKSGYQTITKTNVTVTAGQATTLDVQLPISLSGTVTDMTNGKPISGVTVSAGGSSTQTDSNGYYALGSLPPGVYTVTFSKSGYQTITKTNVTVTAGQATTLDVQLPISLSGTVRDMSTDNPITSVTVSTLGTNTQTDINGYYALGSLSPGVYDVAFSKSGYQTITVTNVVVTAGQGTTLNTYLTTPGPLNITTSNLAPAEVNVAYNDRVRITGGTWPYIYSVASGTLPPGLALDTSYGNISGTPTTAGSYTFTIGVIDKLNAYAEREFTLVVTQQLTITTSSLTRGAKGMPYSFSIQASGGSQPYNFINSTQHTYNLKASSVLWSSAKSLCESSGGYLATITSSDENSTVTNLAVQSGKDAWIGFTDSESEGKWKWVTIESVTYTHWASGEPNNDGDEDCGEIRKDANPSYYWNDAKCSESQNYICEYDGLPPGVYLYTNGNVAGTPLKTDTYQFTVEVLDDSGRTEEKTFTLYVDDPLTITTSRLNDGVIGSDYNQTLNASGGYGAYNWSIYSGNLPSGLSLDSKTGIISGTPTEATYTTIVLSVSDDDDRITYKDFTIQVVNPLQILTTSLPDGLKNEYYSEAIRLDGGIKPFTFSYAGQLPAGLTLNTSTGVISGTPTASGLTNVSITVTDSTYPTHQSVTQNLSIRITTQLVITTSAVLPNAKKGITINPILLVAKGGVSPYSWALITGLMPAGMNLNQQTGELTGLPTNKGDFVFTINVTDTNGATAQKEFFWHVSDTLSIMTGAIPDGAKDIPYSFTLIATGGLQPYSWRLKNGTLPTGLSINGSTGTISGNPTTKQTFSFTIEVSDSDSPAQTAEKTYIMEVLDDLYIYTKTIPNGRINEPYTTTVMAKLGTPPYSWRLESGVLPTGFTLITSPSVATLEGTPTASGTYTFSLEVSDSGTPVKHATRQFTIDIYGDVKFETTALKTANRGIPYSDNIIVSGGTLPYSYKLTSGNLPQGLTLNSTSGHISGTPDSTTSQSSTFTVRVIDSGSPPDSVEKEFVIYVVDPLSITTQDIQSALQKSFYQTTFSGQGGLSPYHWSIQSGNLPQGLQLDEATGVLSGIPVVCGTFDFTVQLTDSSPVPNTTMKTFNLNVVCSDGYELSGKVSTLSDVIMVLSGNTSATTTTDTSGSYKFQHLTNGTYTVTPSKSGYTFNPTNRQVTINGGNQTGIDFTALALSFVTNISSVTVPEGSTATFQVKLSAQPSYSVTASVTRASGDSDITVQSGSILNFTTSNWSTYQTVTLAAAEDSDTTNGTATIRISASGMSSKDITATEQDNDTLSFVTSTDSVTVPEGSTASFQVKLSTQPSSSVTASVTRASGDSDITIQSGSSLIFATTNWSTYQTITLAAAEDSDTTNGTATIRISASGMSSKDITATEQDNDTLSFVASIDSVTVPEGSTATFQVKLSAQPSSTVTALVSYTSGDSDITVQSGSSLSFTTSNWNTYQTVTLAAAEDSDTANGTATIQVSATGISSKSITATEQDNDTEVCTGSTINVGIVSACASGNQVEVPVTINDIAGETGCNFSVSFDKTKLQYTGKTSGTMGGTLLVASVSDINAAGVVQPIVTFDDGGPTSGTICKFEFTLLSPIAEGSQIDLTIGNINAPTVTFCGKNGAVACGGENTTWADVIVEYNNYVSGNVTWDEVIAAYQAYVSQ